MLQGFKNRTYNLGDRVRVYRNLNKGGWSILAMSGENKGRVVAHVDYVTLESVDFVISKAGLARAQASKVRNVHSYAQGILNSLEPLSSDFLCNFRVMAMKKQWGSCSTKGNLMLNPHLVKAPKECIDYVILHELCHIAEHNHSERFWRLLTQVMPNWKEVKAKLDDMAEMYLNE